MLGLFVYKKAHIDTSIVNRRTIQYIKHKIFLYEDRMREFEIYIYSVSKLSTRLVIAALIV